MADGDGGRRRGRLRVALWAGLAVPSSCLSVAGAWVALWLAGPVLGGDRRGDFVGGYFSGAGRGIFAAALGALVLSAPLAFYCWRRALRLLRPGPGAADDRSDPVTRTRS